jgi:transcription elongation factor
MLEVATDFTARRRSPIDQRARADGSLYSPLASGDRLRNMLYGAMIPEAMAAPPGGTDKRAPGRRAGRESCRVNPNGLYSGPRFPTMACLEVNVQ